MRFFFFGTLMDPDVLSLVLARPVGASERVTGRLRGYARARVVDEAYPILTRAPGRAVDGILFTAQSGEEDQRIRFFEDFDYDLIEHRVERLRDGIPVQAYVCEAEDVLRTDHEPWDLATWQRRYKGAFLALTREYMSHFGEMTSEEAHERWEAYKKDHFPDLSAL